MALTKPDHRMSKLLGTVSQVGGQPTGAVVERGSNANGDYIKFADGTLICWRRHFFYLPVAGQSGQSFFSSAQAGLLFPAPFVGVPACTLQGDASGVANWISLTGAASEQNWPGFWVVSETSRPFATGYISHHAIGRWF